MTTHGQLWPAESHDELISRITPQIGAAIRPHLELMGLSSLCNLASFLEAMRLEVGGKLTVRAPVKNGRLEMDWQPPRNTKRR